MTAALESKRALRQRRRRAVSGLAVTTMLLLGLVGAAAVVIDRDAGEDVRVTTDSAAPIQPGQPDDPAAARAAITQALAETRIPGLDPTVIQFVNQGDAVVTTSAYQGVRVRLVEDRWQLHPISACRILDPFAGEASCTRSEPEVLVAGSSAADYVDYHAYGARVAAVDRVELGGQDYVRGPLVGVGSNVWAGSYNRVGSVHTFPPSRLVAFDPDTEELTAGVDLQGEIQSRDEGEGANWVVTHERYIDADGVEYRVKRIDGGGGVVSTPIPPGEVPVGRVVAGAGGVWVPVRSGVLVFDPRTGAPTAKIPLAEQERRGVAVVGDDVLATDLTAIRKIGAGSSAPGAEVVEVGTGGILADVVPAGDSVWVLAVNGEVLRLDPALRTIEARFALSRTSPGASLYSAGDRAWVQTAVDLTPTGDPAHRSIGIEQALFTLDDHEVTSTIVIAGLTDGSATFTAEGDLVVASGGDVYRVGLPT